MKKSILFIALLSMPIATSTWAADCVVHIKRAACAGQETESYKKCNGATECDETEAAAASEAACAKAAAEHCDNKRVEITKLKVVTATFKGAALAGGFAADGKADPKGANFCAADRADMNKCK
ncbi:MAG: hypothetical protein WBQ53_04605 [Methylocystis sp.]